MKKIVHIIMVVLVLLILAPIYITLIHSFMGMREIELVSWSILGGLCFIPFKRNGHLSDIKELQGAIAVRREFLQDVLEFVFAGCTDGCGADSRCCPRGICYGEIPLPRKKGAVLDLSGCDADALPGSDGFGISGIKKYFCYQYPFGNHPARNFYDIPGLYPDEGIYEYRG